MHCVPNALGAPFEQRRVADGGAVERDLVGAGAEQRLDVVGLADAAADGERDEHLLGGACDHVVGRGAVLDGRRDVEEHELVGALGVVARGELDRVAGIAELLEPDALDDAARVDVQARDDPLREHAISPA